MPKILPALCVAVNNLRQTMGWTEAELAESLGVAPNVISDYVRNQRKLDREKAQELVAPMGVGPEAIDEELRCIEATRQRAGIRRYPMPASEAEAEAHRIEAIVQRVSQMAVDIARPVMTLLTIELRAQVDRQQARAPLERLRRRTHAERLTLVRKSKEYQTWALCEAACAESLKVAPRSPKLALEWAELAIEIAQRVPGDDLFRQRLRGYAGCHLGNAYKAGSQPRKADAAFAEALPLFKAGAAADPGLLNEARVLGLEASLRIDQRLPAQALDLLDQGMAVDRHGEAKYLLINRAQVLELLGDYKGAVATLRQAAPLVARDPNARLQLVVEFSLLSNLCHLKQFAEAEALLDGRVRALAFDQGNDLDQLRTRWLTGWVYAGLGRRPEAVALLERVRDEFSALEMPYDTALATSELAVLYLQGGRTAEVKELAVRLAWVFDAEGIEREALSALLLFCEAAREETLTVTLARQIADFLYRAQHDSELRFEVSE